MVLYEVGAPGAQKAAGHPVLSVVGSGHTARTFSDPGPDNAGSKRPYSYSFSVQGFVRFYVKN